MANVYRIGVNIAMSSNGAQLMSVLSRHMLGVNAQANQLTGTMNRLKLAIGGAMAIGAGVAMVTMFDKPLQRAKEFERELRKFQNLGLSSAVNRQAEALAKNMGVAGSTPTENIRFIREATGVFRDAALPDSEVLHGAKLAAPMLAKLDFIGKTLDDEKRAALQHQSLAMLRFVEMAGGLKSPQRFNELTEQGFKAISSSGGNIDWEQLRQFQARAGVAGQNLSAEALFAKLEPVIGELKGSTAGFALRTAYNRVNGIVRIPNQVAHNLVDNGIWDANRVTWNSQGGIKSFNGNPLKEANLFASDPVAFYEKVILPMYTKRGLNASERGRENAMLFGSTGGNMFSLIDRQLETIHKSVIAQAKVLGINSTYEGARKTLAGKEVELQANWNTLMLQFGEHILPMAVKGMTFLNRIMEKFNAFAAANPKMMGFMVKTILVVAAALITLGGAAVAVAAFAAAASGGAVGLVVAGVAAIGGAVAAFIALNWDAVGGSVMKLWEFVSGVFKVAMAIRNPMTAGQFFAPVGMRPATEADNQGWLSGFGPKVKPGTPVYDLSWSGLAKSAVPPPRAGNDNRPIQTTINLDGKKIATAVSAQQMKAFAAGRGGPARPDPGANLPAPGTGAKR